jgi:hypothetical protein
MSAEEVGYDARQTALAGNSGNMTITVIGELNDKTEFYGTDTVLVISPPKK